VAIPAAAVIYGQTAGLTVGHTLVITFLALPLGLMGPDWIIALLRRPYLAALRRGVPDALDLLVVCSEAGMALESALEVTGAKVSARAARQAGRNLPLT
jgi:tight adherence protein C